MTQSESSSDPTPRETTSVRTIPGFKRTARITGEFTAENFQALSERLIKGFKKHIERRNEFDTPTFGKLQIREQGRLLVIDGAGVCNQKFREKYITVGSRGGLGDEGSSLGQADPSGLGGKSPAPGSTNTDFENGLLKRKIDELKLAYRVLEDIERLPPF